MSNFVVHTYEPSPHEFAAECRRNCYEVVSAKLDRNGDSGVFLNEAVTVELGTGTYAIFHASIVTRPKSLARTRNGRHQARTDTCQPCLEAGGARPDNGYHGGEVYVVTFRMRIHLPKTQDPELSFSVGTTRNG